MTEGGPVGTNPLPENVTGEVVESHQFTHRVNHEVNWSVIGGLVFALLLAWLIFGNRDGSGADGFEEIEEEAGELGPSADNGGGLGA